MQFYLYCVLIFKIIKNDWKSEDSTNKKGEKKKNLLSREVQIDFEGGIS